MSTIIHVHGSYETDPHPLPTSWALTIKTGETEVVLFFDTREAMVDFVKEIESQVWALS